jgi:hypothetical protein
MPVLLNINNIVEFEFQRDHVLDWMVSRSD